MHCPNRTKQLSKVVAVVTCILNTGELSCAHACRFWPNRKVEYGWFALLKFYDVFLVCVKNDIFICFQCFHSRSFPVFLKKKLTSSSRMFIFTFTY